MTDLRKAAEQALESMADAELMLRIEDSRMHRGIVNGLAQACDTLRAALQREALNEVHQMDHEEFFSRDDIIRMMREACDTDKVDARSNGFWTITQEELERFAALVAAAEREACARVCEEVATRADEWLAKTGGEAQWHRQASATACHILIRARSKP